MVKWMTWPFFSVLYSTFPDWISSTAFFRFSVIVPFLGEGIKPLGPRILAARASFGIHSAVVTMTSKPVMPLMISFNLASSPMMSAPESSAPFPKARILSFLPEANGRETKPRMFLELVPMWSSKEPSNLEYEDPLAASIASVKLYFLDFSTFSAASLYFTLRYLALPFLAEALDFLSFLFSVFCFPFSELDLSVVGFSVVETVPSPWLGMTAEAVTFGSSIIESSMIAILVLLIIL